MPKFSNPPNQSKGILDDYAVRKNIASREGTIEKVPINDSDIANKKYVDDTAGSPIITHASTTGQTTDDHHDESHTIVSHSDTTATGTELNTLTDDSMADTLHRHSELSASDGTPNPSLFSDSDGKIIMGTAVGSTAGGNRNLHVWGLNRTDGSGISNMGLMTTDTQAADLGGSFEFGGQYINNSDSVSFGRITGRKLNSVSGDSGGYLTLQTRARYSVMTERLRIDDTGKVGIKTTNPTILFSVTEKSGMSQIGGFCIKLTNKTGVNSVAGDVVIAHTTINDAVESAGVSELHPIGVFLESNITDGSEAWIVVSGIADVHMDAGGASNGDRIITSTTAKRGLVNNAPSVAVHFQEIGHCIETIGANGNGRCVLHFL